MCCCRSISFSLSFYEKSVFLGLRNRSSQTNLIDGAHSRSRNAQCDVISVFRIEESLLLQVGIESALRAALGVRNVVSYHYLLTGELTNAAHSVLFRTTKKRKKIQSSNRLRELHHNYLATRTIHASASRTLRSMFLARLLPKRKHFVSVPSGPANAIHTVPTGFSRDPPEGPAMPDVAMA